MTPELVEELTRAKVEYELLPHRHTESAAAEARAVGVTTHEVAKTVVVADDDGYIRAVVPASERVDLHKLSALLGGDGLRLATEAELGAAYPTFELGAVPPIGGPSGDRVVVDRRLAEQPEVVFEAGTHGHSVKLHVSDLVALSRAQVADISVD